jgi:hypothetical protein
MKDSPIRHPFAEIGDCEKEKERSQRREVRQGRESENAEGRGKISQVYPIIPNNYLQAFLDHFA